MAVGECHAAEHCPTPLHLAAEKGLAEAVRLLLSTVVSKNPFVGEPRLTAAHLLLVDGRFAEAAEHDVNLLGWDVDAQWDAEGGIDDVDIDPPGRDCPLFRRAHYRENETRWRRIERFVCDQVPQY